MAKIFYLSLVLIIVSITSYAQITTIYTKNPIPGEYSTGTSVVKPYGIDYPTDVQFFAASNTSISVSWTPSGFADGAIVIANESAPIERDPVDGTEYTAGSDYLSGENIGDGNRVVYVGANSSFVLNGVLPGEPYYFRVIEYTGFGSSIDYNTENYAEGNFTIPIDSEPTVPASNLQFSNITATTVDVSWTNGNGEGRIVVAFENSPVYAEPIDGFTYVANNEYISGENIGGGQRVVYNGSGNSFTLSGLTSGNTYHFRIYEYNGTSSNINYLTESYAEGARQIGPSTPTVAASNIQFNNVTATSMGVSWTNGNGNRRIVVAMVNEPVSRLPINSTDYAENSQYLLGQNIGGGNRVVYDGTGSSFTLTGLTPESTYHFRIYECNASDGLINYMTSSYPVASQVASGSAEPTVAASNLQFANITANSMDVSWTNGNGNLRIVVAHIGSPVSRTPIDGQDYVANSSYYSGQNIGGGDRVVYEGAGNSFTLTGLMAGTNYHFRVYEFNGSGETTNYLISSYPAGFATTNTLLKAESALARSFEDNVKSDLETFNAFPNPSQGIINLRFDNVDEKLIVVQFFHLSGKLVESKTYYGEVEDKVDLTAYEKGVYILKISEGEKVLTRRIAVY